MLDTLLEILINFKTLSPADFRLNSSKQLFSLSYLVATPQNSCLPIPVQTSLPTPASSREVQTVKYKTFGKVKVESSSIRIYSNNKFSSQEDFVTDQRLRIYRNEKIIYERKSFPKDIYGIDFFLRDIDLDGEPEVAIWIGRKTYWYKYQPNCDGYSLLKEEDFFQSNLNERLSKIIQTTRFGDLTARINYDWNYTIGNLTLEITQQGEKIFEELVEKRIVANSGVSTDLRLIDLNNDEDPAVIIKYNSGTSGCCNHTLIYYFDYEKNKFNHFASSLSRYSLEIEKLDGDEKWELLSRGKGFESSRVFGRPILIQHFIHGKFIDVTRRFPEIIRSQNEGLLSSLKSWNNPLPPGYSKSYTKKDDRGFIAAYLAHKYMLGEGEEGWDTLRKVYQESDREEFFHKLEEWLNKEGYAVMY